MKGVWLNRSAAASSIGVSPFEFAQKHLPHLKMKKDVKHPKKLLVFVPVDKMTDMSKENYKDSVCEEDELAEQVEDIIGDVTDFSEVNYTDPRNRATGCEARQHQSKDRANQ